MNYVRPFDIASLAPGQAGPWLVSPDEKAGCAIRLRRGGGALPAPAPHDAERYALILRGSLRILPGTETGGVGASLFIPAGATGAIAGDENAYWIEVEAPLPRGTRSEAGQLGRVVPVDESKFAGEGFAHQPVFDRSMGAQALRMNILRVAPRAGSPDFHIHAFTQIYVIQEGEMTVDIGRARLKAGANTLVYLPEGVVHRNFNATAAQERHVSFLVPEPQTGEIFDYAITIHETEAELLKAVPA